MTHSIHHRDYDDTPASELMTRRPAVCVKCGVATHTFKTPRMTEAVLAGHENTDGIDCGMTCQRNEEAQIDSATWREERHKAFGADEVEVPAQRRRLHKARCPQMSLWEKEQTS